MDEPPLEPDRPLPAFRRDVEAVPFEHEGQPMFLLRDCEGICPHPMAVSPAAMLVADFLDGRRTAAQVCSAVKKASGATIDAARIDELAAQLEKARLLESSEVQSERARIWEAFDKSPSRTPTMAGSGYPDKPLELSGALGAFYRDPKGPGQGPAEKPWRARPPLGIVAPHIDLQRGGPAYAWAYAALSQAPAPDAIIALGVAHASPNSPWALTQKEYGTPYGPLPVDEELYGAVARELWYDPLGDEWAHRREHSLEFQAVWLKSLWRDKTPAWLPILCSSFERFCPDRPPSSAASVEKALAGIGERLAAIGKRRRVLVLAGVDLAHVGPRFGDDIALGPETEKRIEDADRASIVKALALDADGFYLSVVEGGHWRKVCGLSAWYTAARWIKALGGGAGTLLTYGQAPDPLGGIVSFVAAEYGAV